MIYIKKTNLTGFIVFGWVFGENLLLLGGEKLKLRGINLIMEKKNNGATFFFCFFFLYTHPHQNASLM